MTVCRTSFKGYEFGRHWDTDVPLPPGWWAGDARWPLANRPKTLFWSKSKKKTKHIPKNHHQFSPIFRNLYHRFLFETSAAATAQEGRILQLIAIATHPEVSKMGIGYELRSFASGAPRSSRLYSKISVRIDHLVVSVASLKKKTCQQKHTKTWSSQTSGWRQEFPSQQYSNIFQHSAETLV